MPDANQVAESSPATMMAPTDPQEYADWRTGKQPAAAEKPKREAPAPSKPSAAGDEPAEKGAPASEAGDHQESKGKARGTAETRLTELLADLKRAGLSPAELKTFKREAAAATEQPKAAPEKTEKPAEPPKKPKLEDFETYEAYEEARDKYYEDLADHKAQQAVERSRAEDRAQAEQAKVKEKLEAARKRYGEGADGTIGTTAQAIFEDQQIPAPVKALFNDSPILADLLYVMGSKAEEFAEFLADARTNPGAAIRKVVLIERLVVEELAKGSPAGQPNEPGRDESGKFTPAKAPEKKVSEAPPPPKEVSGRGAAIPDEVERAAKEGDFASYRVAANRRDLARMRGQ